MTQIASPTTSSERPTIRVEYDQSRVRLAEGNSVAIEGPVTVRLVAELQSDNTLRIAEQRESVLSNDPPRANAGLRLPIGVQAYLKGCDVQFYRRESRLQRLPRPIRAATSDRTPVNHHVLEFVQRAEQGVIWLGERVAGTDVIGQLARAYPGQSFAIMTATRKQAKLIQWRLRQEGLNLTRVTTSWCPEHPGRIVVGTFTSFGDARVELDKRDILIAYDAREALSEAAQFPLLSPNLRGRVIGLLRSVTLSPLERDRLMATFGPEMIDVPANGFDSVNVSVAWDRYVGQQVAGRKPITIQRRGIWRCEQRNRRLGRLAAALATGNSETLEQRFPLVTRQLTDAGPRRIVVLVDTIEHAISLGKQLPEWPVYSHGTVMETGLTADDLAVLQRGRSRWLGGERCIATAAGLAVISPGTFDTVLWAGGGCHLPRIPGAHLIQPAGGDRRILVIDADDRHHPLLRRWSRRRREAYSEAGWFAPGVNPALGRTLRFLDQCSEATA